jgi:Flp pilus assembly protein TadB
MANATPDGAAPTGAGAPELLRRFAFGLLGLTLIGAGCYSMWWPTLAALGGMAVTLGLPRTRAARRPRRRVWLGTVMASTLLIGVFAGRTVVRMSPETIMRFRDSVRTARDSQEVELPPLLERMAGGKERVKASREIARGLERSPVLFWWLTWTSIVLTSLVLGALSGSAIFAAVMFAGRALIGRWALPARAPPASATPPPLPPR